MAYWDYFPKYVSVAARKAKARKELEKLRKKGIDIQPVALNARTIARSFWGKGWCDHLESFSDFENRLPRGRSYVRNGSVCHLDIKPGRIEAMVSGSSLYKITIKIEPLKAAAWKAVKDKCRGRIGSMLELLQGRLSDHVMAVVSDRKNGLFPQPGEIHLDCSCPDWATMCKHVAAALYGVGSRLDSRPELLFILRGVDAEELIAAEVALPQAAASDDALAEAGLSEIFGIELDAPKPRANGKTPAKVKADPVPAKLAHRNEKSPKAGDPKPIAKPRAKKSKRVAPTRFHPAFDLAAPTGEAIARLRDELGLSNTEFARKLDVTAASVHRWTHHSGTLKIHARHLVALTRLQEVFASKNKRTKKPREIDPSSYVCSCGARSDHFENTIREMKEKSRRRRQALIADDDEHMIIFEGGEMVAMYCPKAGREIACAGAAPRTAKPRPARRK
ncbi:hypothetical protein LLG95_16785 [bacterium]|nr:hypothetical protein [bacterium]